MRDPDNFSRLDSRLALRANEVAASLGVSDRKFRQIASRLPAVWLDSLRIFPVDTLRQWLIDEAERQSAEEALTIDSIVAELGPKR
jgi:hypothetical protein